MGHPILDMSVKPGNLDVVNKPAHFCNLLDYSFRYDCFLLCFYNVPVSLVLFFLCIYIYILRTVI